MTDQPKRFVRMFQPRFAPLVRSGQKCQTIRSWPARVPKVGDIIDCREWSGKPYRSKQISLIERPLVGVKRVRIEHDRAWDVLNEGGVYWSRISELDPFAKADGFRDWDDLIEWFTANHALPFEGILFEGILLQWKF